MSMKLKPCPFCGGEVKVLPWADRHTWGNECPFFCGCSKCRTVGDCYGTEAEAVAAWNTRVERTCRMETEESCQNWMSCSECHADYYNDQPINYCPNCGAKVVEA